MDEYNQYELHHKSRLAAKPGLTGMWQVSGRSDFTDFEEIVKMDSDYIKNWNMPFAVLLLWAFKDEILGSDVRLGKVIWKSTVAVGIFSFGIEFSQVLFHLGTFQISDLVYNTLGGTVGSAVYYVIYRVRHKGE